jgi:hypothetical protein
LFISVQNISLSSAGAGTAHLREVWPARPTSISLRLWSYGIIYMLRSYIIFCPCSTAASRITSRVRSVPSLHAAAREHTSLPVSTFQKQAMAAPNTTATAAPAAPAPAVQVPRGQVDLVDFIDWTGLECLNQDSSHNIANALKQVPCRDPPDRTLARSTPPRFRGL